MHLRLAIIATILAGISFPGYAAVLFDNTRAFRTLLSSQISSGPVVRELTPKCAQTCLTVSNVISDCATLACSCTTTNERNLQLCNNCLAVDVPTMSNTTTAAGLIDTFTELTTTFNTACSSFNLPILTLGFSGQGPSVTRGGPSATGTIPNTISDTDPVFTPPASTVHVTVVVPSPSGLTGGSAPPASAGSPVVGLPSIWVLAVLNLIVGVKMLV